MKKQIYKLSFILLGIILLASCEANDIPTIDESDPTLVQFSTTELVLATPEEGITEEVQVILSSTSSEDRTINVEIDPQSTATSDQFTVSDLVVPAGSYTGILTISGNFEALPEGGSSNLLLNIESVEGEGATIIEDGTLEIEFFRRCAITLDDLVGTWSGTTAEGYPTEVETWLNEDGELMMTGLAFGWFQDPAAWNEVIITNDPVVVDVDLETFDITIAEQPYLTSTYNGAPQDPYTLTASGEIINSCERIIEVRPTLLQDGAAIESFVERIQLIRTEGEETEE